MNTVPLYRQKLKVNDRVRVAGRWELGVGEVFHLREDAGFYVAEVIFEDRQGRRIETLPAERLEKALSPWEKLAQGKFDDPKDFLLRQLAWQFSLGNTGGELTNSRTQLLPHQILLTHDVVKMTRRRLLVADEVGLGKTIETGMIIREGINLQCARILFNYDLPWNPMAVEQRIGRIHRFGQKDVSQVYNLVAKDTVEDRIYGLLTNKLLAIAQAIGKTDPETGEPLEDFRTEILGYLGSSPNYQQLFRQALLDKDYKRTEREIDEMMRQAQEARDALSQLSQDLTHFNLDHYRKITGQFHLAQLGLWCRESIIRLGGSVLPTGNFWKIVTPDCLKGFSQVNAQYDMVTFDRALATRTKKCELFGIGHPLVDALLSYLQNAPFDADTAVLPSLGCQPGLVEARYRVTWHRPEQPTSSTVVRVVLNGSATVEETSLDPDRLGAQLTNIPTDGVTKSEADAEDSMRIWIASRRTEMPQGTIARCELLGVSLST